MKDQMAKKGVQAGETSCKGASHASACTSSWCASSKADNRSALRTRLPFSHWQARQLLFLDLQFLAWLTFTYAMYGVKTTKLLCSQAPSQSELGQGCGDLMSGAPVYCNWAWQVACSSGISRRAGWLGAVPGVSWLRGQLLIGLKAVSSPFFAAWMMSDFGIGISLIEMLLWVAVIFTPALCRAYIRRPWLRCSLVLLHRYSKLLGCWLSLGHVADDHVSCALMGYFLTVGQYAFSGWQNAMTLVPLKLFVVCGLVEWLMICYHITALQAAYPSAAAAITNHSNAVLFAISFVLVYAIPLAITAAVDCRHRRQYRLYAAAFGENAVEADEQYHSLHSNGAGHGSSSSAGASSSVRASLEISGDSDLEASASIRSKQLTSAPDAPSVASVAAKVLSSPGAAALEYLQPKLQSMMDDGSVSQLIEGIRNAAGAATSAGPSARWPTYSSLCSVTNASIKVATDHSNVAALGPLLHASLMAIVAAPAANSGSGSPAVNSVCFEGCVQLLAVMYALKEQQQQHNSDCDHAAVDNDAASSLLKAVQNTLATAATAAPVHVLWGEGFAATTEQQQQQTKLLNPSHNQQPQQKIEAEQDSSSCSASDPTIPVPHLAPAASSSATSAAPFAPIRVVGVKPLCLTVGEQQSLQLVLSANPNTTTSSSTSVGGSYRLLVFKESTMLVSEVVKLSSNKVDVTVPGISSVGIVHVCLVPTEGSVQQQLAGVLHHAMLVLPAAAAAEVHQLWGQAAACDGFTEGLQQHMNACEAVSALTADVAFLLGGSGPSTTTTSSSSSFDDSSNLKPSSSSGQLRPERAAVLKHLLIFLAQHACWELMKFVVDGTAAAAAAGPAHGGSLAMAQETPGSVASAAKQDADTLADSAMCKHTDTARLEKELMTSSPRKPQRDNTNASSSSRSEADTHDYCTDKLHKLPSGSSTSKDLFNKDTQTSQGMSSGISTAHSTGALNPWQQAAVCELAGTSYSGLHSTGPDTAASPNLSSIRYSWWAAARHLLFGFSCPGLESAYVANIAQQTFAADVFAAVYHLVLVLTFRVLTDSLSTSCSVSLQGCVAEGLGRVLYFSMFAAPSVMVVLFRRRLLMSGRRENAALLCEVCLCLLPLLTCLGVIQHGPYMIAMYGTPKWHSNIIFWCGMGLYKPGCRQIRTRLLLPLLLIECVGGVRWALQLGGALRAALIKYGGVILAASITGSAFEIASRRRFLLGVLASSSGRTA